MYYKYISIILIILCLFFIIAGCEAGITKTPTHCIVSETLNINITPTNIGKMYLEWPHWRGPENNGISPESDWNTESLNGAYTVKWKKNIGRGFASVAIKGSYLYTMGNSNNQDTVYCLDAQSGAEIWKYSYSCRPGLHPGPRVTPWVEEEDVYTLSRDGKVFNFNAITGTVKWTKNIVSDYEAEIPEFGFTGSPVIESNMLYLNARRHGMALDKDTGELIWTSEPGIAGYAAPVLFSYQERRCVAIFSYEGLFIVAAETGENICYYPWYTLQGVNAADPIIFDNKIYISSSYGVGCALLELVDNYLQVIWKNGNMHNQMATSVLIDDYLYGNHGFNNKYWGYFRCININTGQIMWTSEEYPGVGTVLAAGDRLILYSEKGDLCVIEVNPYEYKELARTKIIGGVNFTVPVICRGLLYIRNMSGSLLCLDISG